MRLLLTALALAAITTTVMPTLAWAGNQEVADEIAASLRDSGRLSDYKVGVKYQDGTAWLKGRVRDQEQMNAALKLVFQTPGVTRVVNGLTMDISEPTPQVEKPSVAIRPARGATKPEQRSGLAGRLQMVIAGGQPEPTWSAQPASGRSSGTADRLASSFQGEAPRPAAAIEPEPVGPESLEVQPSEPESDAEAIPCSMTAEVRQRRPAQAQGSPIPVAYTQLPGGSAGGEPIPAYVPGTGGGVAPARYDQPCLPNYAWPSYAAYPNYAGVTYPRQYSPTAWPFIGPFYPYPQVPMGWRKVTLEWDDGWWMLDFKD